MILEGFIIKFLTLGMLKNEDSSSSLFQLSTYHPPTLPPISSIISDNGAAIFVWRIFGFPPWTTISSYNTSNKWNN